MTCNDSLLKRFEVFEENVKKKIKDFSAKFNSQPLVVSKFRQSGFAAVDAKEDNPDFRLKNPGSPPQRIVTHIFLQDMAQPELTLHVVVFYPRADFLWTSQIQMPTSDLSFGASAGAYDV